MLVEPNDTRMGALAGDVENDGDLDVAYASGNVVGWIENVVAVNPQPPYGTPASPGRIVPPQVKNC